MNKLLAAISLLAVFCVSAVQSKEMNDQEKKQLAKDITAERFLTNDDAKTLDASFGTIVMLLHGTQHCDKGLKRAVMFNKSTYVAITGCWESADGTQNGMKFFINKPENEATVAPEYVFQDNGQAQLVILQAGANGCEANLKKAFLVEKPRGQVLEGCWKSGNDADTFDITWDSGATQHMHVFPQLYLKTPKGIVGPQVGS